MADYWRERWKETLQGKTSFVVFQTNNGRFEWWFLLSRGKKISVRSGRLLSTRKYVLRTLTFQLSSNYPGLLCLFVCYYVCNIIFSTTFRKLGMFACQPRGFWSMTYNHKVACCLFPLIYFEVWKFDSSCDVRFYPVRSNSLFLCHTFHPLLIYLLLLCNSIFPFIF